MYIIYIYRIRNYVYVFELICDLYDVLVFLSLPSRMLQTLMFCVFWSVFWSDSFITDAFALESSIRSVPLLSFLLMVNLS